MIITPLFLNFARIEKRQAYSKLHDMVSCGTIFRYYRRG